MSPTTDQPLVRGLHRIESLAVSAALALFRALPPAAASTLGGTLARAIGTLLPVSRVADRNLRLALPELDRAARRRVIAGVWENLGRTVGEFPHLGRLRKNTAAGPGWVVEGEEILRAQAERGGPVLFCSAHIGNWEMLPTAVAQLGLPFASFYRAAANPRVDATIRRLRRDAVGLDLPLFPKGARGARAALAHALGGGSLGLLVDQKMNDGIESRFFGHKAMTAPALAALALRLRCPIIPGHVERIGPARLRLVVEPPIPLPDSGDRGADQTEITQRVNDVLEKWIRRKPQSWLWLHRRWPRELQPNRSPP